MKYFICITVLFLSGIIVKAQDSWQVILNRKKVLSTSIENETKNTRLIKSSDWQSSGYLDVKYNDKTRRNWKHLFEFTDENGMQIFTKDSITAHVPLKTLRKMMAGKKQLKIYMMINPPDPMMAAPSRRIHLATLKLP